MKNKKAALIIIAITITGILISVLSNNNLLIGSYEQLGRSLGFLSFVPTVIAVVLAFVTSNVLFSLLIGFLSGVLILALIYSTNLIEFVVQLYTQTFLSIKNVVFDIENIEILLLCFVVGGMIEVVRSSGGFEALATKLTSKINSPRKAGFIASLLGCIIFFDDYANALIVGPIMKPITDRVKVSREKLSYIVDSTAAPVTGIALVSSWVAVEIASIDKGLEIVNSNASGFSLFLNSIPFTFYCLFCLTFIFINSLLGRDFGPMLKAEQRARRGETVSKESKELIGSERVYINNKHKERIFVGVGSIVLLVLFAIVSFYFNGRYNAIINNALDANASISLNTIMIAISNADTINLVTLSAIVGTLFAIIFGCKYKLFNLNDSLKSYALGAKKLFGTILMLIVAWCLADIVERLGTTYYAVEIISANVSSVLVPVLIFLACCIISCASGSYGCLFVVMPLAIPLAYKVMSMDAIANDEIYLYICIGSVMAGSIFGDHCSPVTDCTILSAAGCGCTTMEHCHTQLPYAIVCAIISVLFGIILTTLGLNVFLSLLLGIVSQILLLLLIGKKPI